MSVERPDYRFHVIGNLPAGGGAGGGGGGGDVTNGVNANLEGVGVFDGKNGTILEFRGINSEHDNAALTAVLDAVNKAIDLDIEEEKLLFDYINTQAQGSSPSQIEGRIWRDAVGNLKYWTNTCELDLNSDGWVVCDNETGAQIDAGTPVKVVGASPAFRRSIEETDATSEDNIARYVGLAMEDIAAAGTGKVTFQNGLVCGVDTSAWNVGDRLWISATTGELTSTRPDIPNFPFTVGSVVVKDAVNGIIGAQEQRVATNKEESFGFYTGCTQERNGVVIASDGVTITATIEKQGGGDIVIYKAGGELVEIDTTPAVAVALTAGSDTSPQFNYVYIDHADDTIKASTTAPVGQYAEVWKGTVKSAATVQLNGPLTSQRLSNELHDLTNNGDLAHVSARLRKEPAAYESGLAVTFDTDTGTSPDSITLAISAGQAWQKHIQDFDSIADPAPFTVWNDFTTPYVERTNINAIAADSTGAAWNTPKSFFTLYWFAAVASPDSSAGRIFCTLPSGDYSTLDAAIADASQYANRTAPSLTDGTAVPLYETIIQVTALGEAWTVERTVDLRGNQQGSVAGGGALNALTEFPDNVIEIFDFDDDSARVNFSAQNVPTATTVVITAAPFDVDHGQVDSAPPTTVSTATHTVVPTDVNIEVDYTATGAVTITIDSDNAVAGRRFYIIDTGGSAQTNNITVNTEGGELLMGETSGLMAANFECWEVYCNGTDYFVK